MIATERNRRAGRRITEILWAVAMVLTISYPVTASGKQDRASAGSLIGAWQCTSGVGNASLVFESQRRLVFDGEAATYEVVPGAIRVMDEDGPVDYPYTLAGRRLSVTFPDGMRMQCVKAGGSKSHDSGESDDAAGGAAGRGTNWQLRGLLCSWGGSSSSSSGYSRTTRVSFDGQGGFSYGSESSFSSGAGIAYGSGGGDRGTYRVSGNKVYLTFSDGSTGVANVHMKQNNGMITELMYEGTLYASGLCD